VRGSDFFAADAHRRISFHSTRVELAENGTATIDGLLDIRGIQRPVTAAGTFTPPNHNPFGNIRLGFALEAVVDRRSWGMDSQMPLPARGDALGWDVVITAPLELTKSR
jgi:polyisoprenoid-binding protein YceI